MEREVVLRAAVRADIEEILALQQAAPGAAVWESSDYASALADTGTLCLLAVDRPGRRVAAFLVGRILGDEVEILNLAVGSDYRRQGIGRGLVSDALARAQAQGARQCWLEVRAANQPARDFYRALGFSETSWRRGYYREPVDDAVVCVRLLAAP